MKQCSCCKKNKELNFFYKAPKGKFGVRNICKECYSSITKTYKKVHPEKMAAWKKAYNERNNKKVKCRNKLNYSIHIGKIQKNNCELCNDPNVQAHHDDYDKPFNVRWLCDHHHKEEHKKYNF